MVTISISIWKLSNTKCYKCKWETTWKKKKARDVGENYLGSVYSEKIEKWSKGQAFEKKLFSRYKETKECQNIGKVKTLTDISL